MQQPVQDRRRDDRIAEDRSPVADSDEGDRGSGLMVISIPGSM